MALVFGLAACGAPPVSLEANLETPLPKALVVSTDPPAARCQLLGRFARRDARRAPIELDPRQLGYPVTVACTADGYFETREVVHVALLPPIARSLEAGALLTVMASYAEDPGIMTVFMRPRLFETLKQRDTFYAIMSARRAGQWQFYEDLVRAECDNDAAEQRSGSAEGPPINCRKALDWLDQQRAADLRSVEIDRRRAGIR